MEGRPKTSCSHPRVERCSRSGLLDAWMYRMGKYPWHCSSCGSKLYFQERRPSDGSGAIRSSKGAPVGPVPAAASTAFPVRSTV